MRQRLDFTEADEVLFRARIRKAAFVHTLTADNYDIAANSPPVLVIDPGGASRDVRLPDLAVDTNDGLEFLIINTADAAENLVVKDSAEAGTIATIAQNGAAWFWNNGTTWFGYPLNSEVAASVGTLSATGIIQSDVGVQSNDTAITATADGLTTGIIPSGTGFAAVTSANANNIITLPSGAAGNVGHVVRGWVGANGCEIRTPATSGATINGVDSDGTNEAAIPATTLFTCSLVAVDTWILEAVTELGAVITAIVPDAA